VQAAKEKKKAEDQNLKKLQNEVNKKKAEE